MRMEIPSLFSLFPKRLSSINRDPKVDRFLWEAHEENPRTCEWCGEVSPTYTRRELLNREYDENGKMIKSTATFVERCFVCDAGVEIRA